MRQTWTVLLELDTGKVMLAHPSGAVGPGFQVWARVEMSIAPPSLAAVVEAADRRAAVASANDLRARYLIEGTLPEDSS